MFFILYYFSKLNTSYKNVWFIEEDVYVPNEKSIINIDNKYKNDLLCNKYQTNKDGQINGWEWVLEL